ncbi:MAG: AgmX/PglI C-terminal domain-containing protein [Polyangiaceae bacterium]
MTGPGARPDGSGAAQVVYLGDGSPRSGELDATSIAARVRPVVEARHADLRLLGAGRTVDEVTLRGLAAELGATYEAVRSGGALGARAEEIALALRSPVLRSPKVELPAGLEDVQPRVLPNLRLGEEIQLVGRLRAGADLAGALRLTGVVDGRPYARSAALRWDQARAPNPLLPRVWAEARIADLGASVGPEAVAEVVALSTRYHVMSRHTSLLVLENERMFAQFGIERTARRAEERADHRFGAMSGSGRLGGSHQREREGEAADVGALKKGSGEPPVSLGGVSGGSPLGDGESRARGNLWGDERADMAGGLGLSGKGEGSGGKGEGGGGKGEGIGLGSVGSLGHGAGSASGSGSSGFGGGLRPGVPGHTAKPPQVRMGASMVSGRLPPEIIQRIVRQHFGRLRSCYERSLKPGFANAAGRVSVRFLIGGDGAVRNAASASSELGADVTDCVVGVFQGMVFPAADASPGPLGGPQGVTVVYPILFAPGDGPPGTPVAQSQPPNALPTGHGGASRVPSGGNWRGMSTMPSPAPPPQQPSASHRPGDERWRSEGEDALAKLRARRAEQPEVRAAHAALVKGLLARGRFPEALSAAGRFGEVDPDSSAARELLAQAAAATGDQAMALAAVDAHVETEPRSRAAHLRAARALEAARDERDTSRTEIRPRNRGGGGLGRPSQEVRLAASRRRWEARWPAGAGTGARQWRCRASMASRRRTPSSPSVPRGASSHAARISLAMSAESVRLDRQSTLAWFHLRAPEAVPGSAHSAARIPQTLFAAMLMPVPVQHRKTPSSQAPPATASAACSATSAHASSRPLATAPKRTTSWPRRSSSASMTACTG